MESGFFSVLQILEFHSFKKYYPILSLFILKSFMLVSLIDKLKIKMSSFLYASLEMGRIMWLGMAGGHPHRFPHNNFSSVYRIFTKHGHMIPLWKRKNPIYFGVIRSKIKVTITINGNGYRLINYIDGHILWCTHFLFFIVFQYLDFI